MFKLSGFAGLLLLAVVPNCTPKLSIQTFGLAPVTDKQPLPKPEDWRPNVLVILSDQLNVRMMGHENNGFGGVPDSLTPNLDALAAEGVRFSNASCASAVCQPSRVSIFTGRWPFNHGVRLNGIWEPRTETLFPELARAAGYATANVGLHHLMWDNQLPGWGDDHGFDEIHDFGDYVNYCSNNGVPSYSLPSNTYTMPGLPVFGEFEKTGYSLNSNQYHPTSFFADKAIDFLKDRAGPEGDGRPFCLWYSMLAPHTPILPSGVAPDDYAHLFHPFSQLSLPPNFDKLATIPRLAFVQSQFQNLSQDEFKEALSYYYGLIRQLDHNIGRVLDELDALGLTDDTLVIFSTDHGELAAEMGAYTKGAGSYDALTRIPLIARLPGVLPAGRVVEEPAINIDIFPTLVEATGVPITEQVREAVDGVSLMDLMIEPAAPAGWRQEAFHALGSSEDSGGHQFMVRTADAKYTLDEWGGVEEFYDLAADPWETNDLFESPDAGVQAQIADLQGRFHTWWNAEAGHAPHYRLIGAWGATPARARTPYPADGEIDVPLDADLAWLPSTGALLQKVHFGAGPAALESQGDAGHMADGFNPGALQPNTTYHWRVDGTNGNGTAVGFGWSFTTVATGVPGPAKAIKPLPAHREEGLPLATPLRWTVSPSANFVDLHFGPTGDVQPLAQQLPATTNSWSPGHLRAGVTYEWRIDTIDDNGTTEGDTWRFVTDPSGLPGRAVLVHPGHLSLDLAASPKLRWKAGPGAKSHDVYFGTSFPLTFQGNQTGTTFDPGPLAADETYYWRVDEVNARGTITGWTWRFTR